MDHIPNREFVQNFQGLAYPLTNNNNYTFSKFNSEKDFSNKIKENIIFFDNINEIDDTNSEIFLLNNNESFDITINLKYNENLSQERNKITKEKSNLNKNILFIYIDSLSRPHFFRKMKLVTKFLEKFNSEKNNTNYESFQFMKYQTFKKDYYKSSIQTIFYSHTINPNSIYQNIHILSNLKKNGYVCGQSANICSKEFYSYDLEKETNYFKTTKIEEYDHENIAMFCDPFYFDDSEDTTNSFRKYVKGVNSSIKRCMYGKNSFEYILEYGYQFWSKYQNNTRFLRLGFFDGNEKTGEVIKYLDNYLYDYLNKLYKENLLKNTILFIVSGQGNIYGDFFNTYIFEDFSIEKYIGTLFILIDKSNIDNNEIFINIRNNQQNMVTPYDIKETLESIMYNNFINSEMEEKESQSGDFNRKGKSLFKYINPKKRNCERYKQLNEEVCRCYEF